MTDLTVSTTILEQLGGRRFTVMTGARDFVGSPDALSFRLPQRAGGPNRVRVALTPSDTYHVEFYRVRAGKATLLGEFDQVYCDQLVPVFEKATGLRTRL